MNLPAPAIAANPLHLFDLTHGRRRLSVWPEHGHDGKLALHAALAVPVTMQEPGEPPETEWITVATARSWNARLANARADADNWRAPIAGPRLVLDNTEFALLSVEVEPLAAYLIGISGEPPA